MSKVQQLRVMLKLRLTAADEEIFHLFEGIITDYEGMITGYEEEICRLKEEIKGWKVLDAIFNPQVCLYRADMQLLLVSKEDVLPEQQEWNQSLDQKDSEPPNIQENQEGNQLYGLGEADITEFPFTVVSVKSEDEEKPQLSQLHQSQSKENKEVELLSSNSTEHRTLKTEADGEDCGGSQPASSSGPCSHFQPHTDDMQLLLVSKEDVLPEQQEWNQSLDQKGSEPPNIKEEQEELWVNQEGKQRHGLGEADITKFYFTVVSVKSEDEEKPQLSQLHQSQSKENKEVELLSSNSTEHRTLKTEADGEDCGGSQPASSSGPCSHFQPDTDGMSCMDRCTEEGPTKTSLCGNHDIQTKTQRKYQPKMKRQEPNKSVPYVKRPPNAFMMFISEQRECVMEQYGVRDCAIVNNILGDLWKNLTVAEKAKYYKLAEEQKILHSQLHPNWSARDNYGRKRKRVRATTSKWVEASEEHHNTEPGMVLGSEDRPQTQAFICNMAQDRQDEARPDIKKPPNAYILFNREQRPLICSLYNVTDSSTISRILSQKWKSLSLQEKSKYFRMAEEERNLHYQLYPNWSPKENYGKKTKRDGPMTSNCMEACAADSQLQKKYVKKPANAFMIFMREERERAMSQYNVTESTRVNQLLGEQWKAMTREEKAKYFEMAKEEKILHSQLNPNWSFRDNYAKKVKMARTQPSS